MMLGQKELSALLDDLDAGDLASLVLFAFASRPYRCVKIDSDLTWTHRLDWRFFKIIFLWFFFWRIGWLCNWHGSNWLGISFRWLFRSLRKRTTAAGREIDYA